MEAEINKLKLDIAVYQYQLDERDKEIERLKELTYQNINSDAVSDLSRSQLEEAYHIECMQNSIALQEIVDRQNHISKLLNVIKGLYVYVDSPLDPSYEFAMKEAKDILEQHENGFL